MPNTLHTWSNENRYANSNQSECDEPAAPKHTHRVHFFPFRHRQSDNFLHGCIWNRHQSAVLHLGTGSDAPVQTGANCFGGGLHRIEWTWTNDLFLLLLFLKLLLCLYGIQLKMDIDDIDDKLRTPYIPSMTSWYRGILRMYIYIPYCDSFVLVLFWFWF